MKPQEDFVLPTAEFDILHCDSQVCLDASIEDIYVLQRIHSLVSCITGLLTDIACFIWDSFDGKLGFLHKTLKACLWFSEYVIHSKLSTRLSSFTPFLWLTVFRFLGLSIYDKATALWAYIVLWPSVKNKYQFVPHKLNHFPFLRFDLGWLHILPFSVTAYRPSYQGISFIKIIEAFSRRLDCIRTSYSMPIKSNLFNRTQEYYRNIIANCNLFINYIYD